MRAAILLLLCVALAHARVNLKYDSKADEHNEMDWYENGVFYQIYPRSFKDSNGDGFGDLKGIKESLSHLKDLGVTGAWLSPIFKSPMVDGGYDIEDFTQVNPLFGTNEDLTEVFATAKALGLKIILDFVPNHTSDQHEWFKKSVANDTEYSDFYVWHNGYVNPGGANLPRLPPNNWQAVFNTPAWTWHPVRGQFYLHQFAKQQPDLNYRNPKVQEAMRKVLLFWLDRGVDGFRIDAINHSVEDALFRNEELEDKNGPLAWSNMVHIYTKDLQESYDIIYDWRKLLDQYSKDKNQTTKLMMTEAYGTLEQQTKWYGNKEGTILGSHLPFNFALISDLDKNSNAMDFKKAVDGWMDTKPDYGTANWVLGNHDRTRLGDRYGEARHESLAIMTMMLGGINVVYYGEEILMTDNNDITWEQTDDPQACNTNEKDYKLHSRDPVRTPFQWDDTLQAGFSTNATWTWLPVNPNYKTKNLKAQKAAAKSTFKLYQSLIKMRENPVLMYGGVDTLSMNNNEVFGYLRTLAEHNTMAVFVNFGAAKTVDLKELMKNDGVPEGLKAKIVIVNNDSKLKIGEYVGDVEKIELGPFDAVVLEVSSANTLTISIVLLICSFVKFMF